jgi:O-antigen ligase
MATTAARNTLYIATLSLIALGLALLLLSAFDVAIAVFILGFLLVMLVFSPYVGLVACLLFLYIRPFDYTPGLMETRSFLLMISATFLVTVFRHAVEPHTVRLSRDAQHVILGWFVLAIVASHVAHLDFSSAVDATFDFVKVVILYLLVTSLVTTPKRLRTLVAYLVLATVVLALMGLLQKLTGVGPTGVVPERGRITAIGAAEDPNMFAQTLLVGIPFLFFAAVSRGNVFKRLGALVLIGFLGYMIYETNSRGGNLSFAILLALMVTRSKGLRFGIPTLAVALVAVLLLGPSRMEEVVVRDAPRIPLWEQGFVFFQSNPLFGIGKDAWTSKFHMMYAHNSFIQCAAEMGIFGLVPWVLIIYVAMRNLSFVRRCALAGEDASLAVYADGVFFALVGFLLPAMFLSKTYSWLLFLLVGLATAVTNIFIGDRRDEYVVVERKDFFVAVILSVAGLVAFKAFVTFATGV